MVTKKAIAERYDRLLSLQLREATMGHEMRELRQEIEAVQDEIQGMQDVLDWEQTKATMIGREL